MDFSDRSFHVDRTKILIELQDILKTDCMGQKAPVIFRFTLKLINAQLYEENVKYVLFLTSDWRGGFKKTHVVYR